MSEYIVAVNGNCKKSDIGGLSALQYLNSLPKHYRLNEYGDDIGMDSWTMSAKSKREKQQFTLKSNALKSSKAKKKYKAEIKKLLNNSDFNEERAQLAPSVHNMPLGYALSNQKVQIPKDIIEKVIDPKLDEVLTIEGKQYVLANMTPDEINETISKWKAASFDEIRDLNGPGGWIASLVEPYCQKTSDGLDLGVLGTTGHHLVYDMSAKKPIRALILASKNLK